MIFQQKRLSASPGNITGFKTKVPAEGSLTQTFCGNFFFLSCRSFPAPERKYLKIYMTDNPEEIPVLISFLRLPVCGNH
jgi:hypothetical protein